MDRDKVKSDAESNQTETERLRTENQDLKSELLILKDSLLKPFMEFERLVRSEYSTSPYLLMEKYEEFIGTYADSYWAHEAKKRLKNIRSRLKYYDAYKGWQLPQDLKDETLFKDSVISCPGC
jgi:hypothetical protein